MNEKTNEKERPTTDVLESYTAVILINPDKRLRLSGFPSRSLEDTTKATKTRLIERRRSFPPGIVITELETPTGKPSVTCIPWSAVLAVHG